MDFLIAMGGFAAAMLGCLLSSHSMLWGLLAGLAIFLITAHRRGFGWRPLCKMVLAGAKRALIVLRIFAMVGLITGLWRASGTISCCIYWGIQAITPNWFLLIAFLVTSLVSYALGTSFGVAGTVGVIFMSLARSGGVNEVATAGVLLSAIYFGDRGAPSSSCAHLVAAVTNTDIDENVRWMLKTSLIPFLLATGFYALLSPRHPIGALDAELLSTLSAFDLSLWTLLPAALMLLLPLCRVKILYALSASILSAGIIAGTLQHMDIPALLRCAVLGFSAPDPAVAHLFNGGGLVSMLLPSCIVTLSSTYFGIFQGTRMLDGLQDFAARGAERLGRFPAMLLSAVALCAVFCNQTIATMMSSQIWSGVYEKDGAAREEQAMDTANSTVVVAALIPWNLACSGPLALLGADARALPYAVFVYALPLFWLVGKRFFFPSAMQGPVAFKE